MSMATMNLACKSNFVFNGSSCNTNIFKRFAHQATDFSYFTNGIKKPEYHRQFEHAVKTMQQYPQLMNNYFRSSAVMKQKGKVPFVHAQSSLFRFPRIFLETVNQTEKHYPPFFKFLRQPSQQFDVSAKEVKKKVDYHVKKHGDIAWTPGMWNPTCNRLDHDPNLRPYLVSVNYSMMDFGMMESSYHFLFSNSNASNKEDAYEKGMQAISTSLKRRGKEAEIPFVFDTFKHLQNEYENLKIGSLVLIGVPESIVETVAFDCKSFGIPTSYDVLQVAKNPSSSSRAYSDEEGGLQARIMVCKETMNPVSGIEIIDVNDTEEVEHFCKGFPVKNPTEIEGYSPFFKIGSSFMENMEHAKRKQLDVRVKQFAQTFIR